MHEASLHDANCFVTLTYDDEHVPPDGSLDKQAFPLFMKRLRKKYRARYMMCGEYGDTRQRPHYHACLFGMDFPDKVRVESKVPKPYPEWVSAELMELWPFGLSLLGSVTFESAAYVAAYCVSPLAGIAYRRGDREDFLRATAERYERLDPFTGELYQVEPEFFQPSRRPGIGRGWYDKYSTDVFPADEVVVRGKSAPVPRYYDTVHEAVDPAGHEEVCRVRRGRRRRADQTPERLQVRELCAEARFTLHKERAE